MQANTGVLSGYRRDATVRSVGVGWRELAAEIEAVRLRVGAGCVLAPDYGTTGWLAFYLPKGTCVVQPTQRIRWVNMPEPDPALLAGKLLYVDEMRPGGQPQSRSKRSRVSSGSRNCRASAARSRSKPTGSICSKAPRAMCSTVRRRRNWSRGVIDGFGPQDRRHNQAFLRQRMNRASAASY